MTGIGVIALCAFYAGLVLAMMGVFDMRVRFRSPVIAESKHG